MTPERWQQISTIFKSAVEREPGQRAVFLDQACAGDDSLRQQVESLIASHGKAGNFIESPAHEIAAPLLTRNSNVSKSGYPNDDPTTTENDRNRETVRDGELNSTSDQVLPNTVGLQAGSVVSGRYVIEKELGRGGIGVVYLARDKELLMRPVVVKILLEQSLENQWVVQKFRQEMEALTRIEHPGIIGVLGAGETAAGRPYLVMQYVEGGNLRDAMKTEGMDLERVAQIVQQVSEALSAAHDAGVLHRDLKPENIMLRRSSDGREDVRIIDFGIAKIKDSVVAPSTVTSMTVGTISYMAPEQLSAKPVSAASDVYALGSIAYEMVTGRKPFNPDSMFQLLEMQREGVRVRPQDLRPALPEAAQQVILKALSFNPRDRYQGARDFGAALARALTDDTGALEAATLLSPATQLPQVSGHPSLAVTTPPWLSPADWRPAPAMEIDHALPKENQRRAVQLPAIIAAVLAAIIGAGLFTWAPWRSSVTDGVRQATESTTSPNPAATERALSYWVEVQKYRNGKPDKDPLRLPGEMIFQADDRVRFNFDSPQAGYLYIVNEGPLETAGLPTFNVLFPTPTANEGSPAIKANQRVQVPEQGWFIIDDERGTEKLWLIWSAQKVIELDAIAKDVVTSKAKGVISDPSQIRTVRSFIAEHSSSQPNVERDGAKTQTTIRGTTDVLIDLIKLEHY